jgi:two-component system cell cycle sensor histidine kinase PleC
LNYITNMPASGVVDKALSELSEPAVIVDCARGILLGANAAGQHLWGGDFTNGAEPARLDVAMPAITSLRGLDMDGDDADRWRDTPLTFWTPHGVLARLCRVRRLLRASDGAAFVVTWPSVVTASAGIQETVRAPKGASMSNVTLHPFSADAETLRKIAKRIRDKPEADPVVPAPWPPNEASPLGRPAADDQADREPDALAKLAHELRTPLAAIIALSEIMTEQHLGALPNERYRGYMRDIRDSARHALGLVDGLFARGDLEKDHDELFFSEADLNQVARSCVSALQPLADKAGVTLSSALTTSMPRVIADVRCLKQILLNLLSNSIKYAGREARVTVTTGFELAGRAWIDVQDTGPGIAPDVIDRLSRPGPLPGVRPKPRARKGLGLPLSRRLAEINGARLEIANADGGGACVRVVFARDRVVPV